MRHFKFYGHRRVRFEDPAIQAVAAADLKRACLHEAAHCVAAHYMNIPIIEATAEGDKGRTRVAECRVSAADDLMFTMSGEPQKLSWVFPRPAVVAIDAWRWT